MAITSNLNLGSSDQYPRWTLYFENPEFPNEWDKSNKASLVDIQFTQEPNESNLTGKIKLSFKNESYLPPDFTLPMNRTKFKVKLVDENAHHEEILMLDVQEGPKPLTQEISITAIYYKVE